MSQNLKDVREEAIWIPQEVLQKENKNNNNKTVSAKALRQQK